MSESANLKNLFSFDERIKDHDILTSRHILKAIYDCTQSSIYIISTDYKLLYFNRKATEGSKLLYGKDLRLGDSILNVHRQQMAEVFSTFKRNLEMAMSGTTTVSERELQHPNLSTWIRAEYSPVFDDQKVVAVCLRIKEINDRKEFEGQIEKQKRNLKEIAWIQSHETRQPVATILGLINILDKSTLTEQNREIVSLLENTINKLDHVIRDTVIKANSLER